MPDEGFIGIARPSEEAELPPLVPGLISTVLVTEGQYVSKGTPLIALDDQVPRARLQAATVEAGLTGALKRAQVDLRMAESRLERLRFAVQSGAGAVFELEEAESVVEQTRAVVQQQSDLLRAAEANRQLAEAQLKQYTVHAPFDGVVTTIHQRSGMVEPSRPVVAIANLNRLDVELHLPSRLYGKIKTGQTLPLLASSPVHQPISGNVVSVSPVINAASDTFRCRLEILNANKLLPAGFTVRLDSSNKNVATVGI
ncbi:MAG: efflux RND transporter periplasmic adaptor subunit [Planctomycetaceae bacterium]|nr:efflux RND transporter periplasmic adaptor subunit [Planctomycetaceae bacterium]